MTSTNWCFTLNNYTEDEVRNIMECPDLKYVVCGKEVGAEGTPHIQGFLIYKNKCRMSAIKKLMPRAHIEAAKGNAYQAAKYCQKDSNFQEKGTPPLEPAKRRKAEFTEVMELARAKKYRQLMDEYPGMTLRYWKTLKEIGMFFDEPVDCNSELDNYWYYGASGSGKSSTARQRYPGAYIKMANKWWNHYAGEAVVIIDDLSPNHYALIDEIKTWTDHYPCPVETKFGMLKVRPKTVVVTSQYTPEEVFKTREDCAAISRRFKLVKF